jgi:hypothetical protein
MSPHGPRPWRWDENGKDLRDANGRSILEISGLQFDADAGLIVEAPELLHALEVLLRFARTHIKNEGSGLGHACLQAQEVIDRVEREAPALFDDGQP